MSIEDSSSGSGYGAMRRLNKSSPSRPSRWSGSTFASAASGSPLGLETFEIYSSFYYVGHQPLNPGGSLYINVLDSKTLHRIEIRVLRRERIKVPAGEFDTLVIEPMVRPWVFLHTHPFFGFP